MTTDKVQKIREEVARIQLYTQSEVLKQVLDYIDEVQKEEIPPKFPIIPPKKCMYTKDDFTDEDRKVLCDGCKEECEYAHKEEPVSKVYTFKSIPRLLDMIQPSDRANTYITKLADSLDEQGYHTDAKIVRESIKIMNGDKVAMATMDEEPVSKELEEEIKRYQQKDYDRDTTVRDVARHFADWQKRRIVKEIKSRLVDAATNQDNSTDVTEQTYYNGMVDALGRLRDKFMED